MSAPVVSEPRRRLRVLLRAVIREGGEWTTERVRRTYQRAGVDAPQRTTARHGLAALRKAGHLILHDGPARRYYTPKGAVCPPRLR